MAVDNTTKLERGEVDLEAVRAKYREERDKRVKPEGKEQYVEIAGEFSYFLEDPYADSTAASGPTTESVTVAIVGGGFSGILTAVELREAGINDFRILEKGSDFGGTWYWNRYPGVACDMESYVYLPLLEETGYEPEKRFSTGDEIREHCRRIARQWELYERAKFQTEVSGVTWDESESRWHIETQSGDRINARYVILANGPLHRPKLPGIKGIDAFAGHTFHTSRWDYDYTGGDASGGLTNLKGKRVGIIGTGATAVQCVPYLAEHSDHLFVFQRTPSSVDVRGDRPTDHEWFASQPEGWQKARMDNFNTLTSGGVAEEDLVNDGWTEIMRRVGATLRADPSAMSSLDELMEIAEVADFEKMEQLRSRVEETVTDPKTAEALKPYYRQFCKRPCFDDKYLETFNRDNVTLVDTQGQGIAEITERGVVHEGREYEVDCLIFATGFEVGTEYSRRCGYPITGRNGQTLTEKWENGVRTYHGMHLNGFPNCLVHQLSQGGLAFNYVHAAMEYAKHMTYVISQAEARGAKTFEATAEAEDNWIAECCAAAQMRLDFLEGCTPGYYNNEGVPDPKMAQNGPYGGGAAVFFGMMDAWRQAGDLRGLTIQ